MIDRPPNGEWETLNGRCTSINWCLSNYGNSILGSHSGTQRPKTDHKLYKVSSPVNGELSNGFSSCSMVGWTQKEWFPAKVSFTGLTLGLLEVSWKVKECSWEPWDVSRSGHECECQHSYSYIEIEYMYTYMIIYKSKTYINIHIWIYIYEHAFKYMYDMSI